MSNEQSNDYTLLFQVVTVEPTTTISYSKRSGFEQVLQASKGGVMLLQRHKNSISPKLWSSLREHVK